MGKNFQILADGCSSGPCPTVYKDEEGKIYVQGYKVGDSDKTSLGIPDNEDMVEISTELLEELKKLG